MEVFVGEKISLPESNSPPFYFISLYFIVTQKGKKMAAVFPNRLTIPLVCDEYALLLLQKCIIQA